MRREVLALPVILLALLLGPAAARADIPELAGEWHLDSVIGATTPDSSGHNLTATVVGAPLPVSPARFGDGLRFPTEGDYVDAGDHPELQPATVSVLAWVRSDSVPTQVKAIVSQGAQGSCAYSSYSLYTGGSLDAAGLRFYVHVGGGVVKVSPPADNAIWNGQWHLVAGTYDGAAVRLFVDGQEVGSGTPAAGPIGYGLNVNNDFIIGGAKAPACIEQTNFTGDLDEVRVYNRALTTDEIAYLARPDHTAPPELPIPAGTPPPEPPAPPPAEPAPPPGRNTQAPSIQTGNLDGGLRAYSCLPGTWADINDGSGFQYTWWRQNSSTSATGVTVPDTNVRSDTDPLYRLPTADLGKAHYCEVTATGLDGQPVRASSTPRILTGEPDSVTSIADTGLPVAYGNIQIRGIDVIQTTQPNFRSARFPLEEPIFPLCGAGTPTNFHLFLGTCQTLGDDPQHVGYRGVTLDARKRTFALVYLSTEEQTPFPLRLLDVTLTARIGGQEVGSDWKFTVNPLTRLLGYVSFGERADPTGESRVAFELDPAWLAEAARQRAELSLTARAEIAPGLEGLISECLGARDCGSDNRFQLDGVPVRDDLPALTVKTVALLTHKQQPAAVPGAGYPLADPDDVLARTRQLFPGGERLNVLPYRTVIDIDLVEVLREVSPYCAPFNSVRECRETFVTIVVDDWLSGQSDRNPYDILMAVHHFHEQPGGRLDAGWEALTPLRLGQPQPRLFAGDAQNDDGTADRPVTGAAHLFGHAMGARDAGTLTEDPATGRACEGGPLSTDTEPWPDDDSGRLQSAAYDPQKLLRMDTSNTPLFDLMSNCATESDAWISAFNWTRAFETMHDYGDIVTGARHAATAAAHRGPAASATQAGQAYVSGVVGPKGATIFRVVPADPQNNPPSPDPSSPLQVRVLDAGGKQLAIVGAPIARSSLGSPDGTFVVAIPNGADAVELVSAGQVLDRKTRSRPPKVRLRAPRGAIRVRSGVRSALKVRWAATDPDKDALDATVEYAANGRSGWRPVFKGPSTGSATVPGRFLERGTGARIRVRISDGFNETIARSGPFTAEGTPPVARIVLPQTSTLPPGRVEMRGTGFDDRNGVLPGRALTWFAGKRRLGRGDHLRVRLAAGHVKLRLQARDRFGRVATAVRRITVNPVQIQIRTFIAPAHVAKGARSMKAKVATSTAATLRAGGRSFAVGPRVRTLSIPLPAKPGTGILKIKLSVTARGPRQRVLQDMIRVLRS